ncbi:MAG: hypothetical protein IPJ81_08355 [Chitinophagaceae bacterium]|nr:hypothetical protein [Chitinophagaceae bacterium]
MNIAFEHFANFTTGFGKSWQDYVAFEKQCTGGNTIYLNLKMFLSGAYADKNLLMRDDLRNYNLLPLSDPYFSDPLLVANYFPKSNHKATKVTAPMFADKGDQSIVDWVWIQLHDSKDSCKILATHTGLLQKDGFVINTDGSALSFTNMPNGQYYVSVRHRNHLGVMTKTPVNISNGDITSIDFTDINTETFGTNAQYILNNKAMLWGGDGNANGVVRFNGGLNDKDYLLLHCLGGDAIKVLILVYNNGDYNMNGLVNYNGGTNDKDFLLASMLKSDAAASIKEQRPCSKTAFSKVGLLRLKMFLGGAYDSQTGLMRDDLRTQKLLPYNDPYFTDPLLATKYFPSAYHKPIEASPLMFEDKFNQTKEQAIVDWVWVQLHDSKDSCKIISTQSGLVLRNGDVIAVNGSTELTFPNLENGNYFVSVRHRNHIGAMTKVPIQINNIGSASVDFTNINTETFGADAQKIYPNNVKALWGGNTNANKLITYNGNNNDREYILNCLNGDPAAVLNNVYSTCDVNMNGLVSYNFPANDAQEILANLDNNPFGSRIEQIPFCAILDNNNFEADCNSLQQTIADYYNSKFNIFHDQDNVEKGVFFLGNNYTGKDWTKFSLKDFIKDGYFGDLPDTVITGRNFSFGYNLPMCTGNPITFETRLKLEKINLLNNDAGEIFITLNTDKGKFAPVFNHSYSHYSGFVYPKNKLGIKEMVHKFNQWDTIKIVMRVDTGFVFINNQQVGYYDFEPDMDFSRLNSYAFSMTRDFQVDWVKIYNDKGTLQYQEDFEDYSNFTKVPYDFVCNNITCKTGGAFADFFNNKWGTNYSYEEIVGLYKKQCAILLESCKPNDTPPPMLCGLNEPTFKPLPFEEDPCKDLPKMAYTAAEEKWELYKDSIQNVFDTAYYNKCMKAKDMESLKVTYTNSEYHYTLYYYDQAGNLVKTVPPAGVDAKHGDEIFLQQVATARLNVKKGQAEALNKVVPGHTLVTDYRYNTLNQVVAQKRPMQGKSTFWYDILGRLAVSQNSKQLLDKKYSYTLYDELGRITEVGQKPQTELPPSKEPGLLEKWLAGGGLKEQITRTSYDLSYYDGKNTLKGFLEQRNLRNRVSYSMVFDQEPDPDILGTHSTATFYSYDIHGNVDTLLQDFNFGEMKATGNRFKKLAYDYDLISGKVNKVAYQAGEQDEFYHKYFYDAENRLTDVYTSKDSFHYERDSRYDYYKHGPLAKQIVGQNQVQGFDYAYTLQGWLKGMNSTAVGDGKFDMGGDGTGANAQVARDAFGFALHYFSTANAKDYKPIGGGQPFANAAAAGFGFVPLYNGNIAATSMNIPTLGDALLETFRYDQLQRLTKVNTYKGLNPATNNWNVVSIDDHREEISYDANGNIQTYKRNGSAGNLNLNNYSYTYQANTNRLISLKNAIDNKITAYGYDAIGNVIKDEKQNVLNNTWNVYGKLQKVEKKDGKIITYSYDAGGNRISKTVGDTTEIYVRNASGNIMLSYQKNPLINSGHISTKEFYKYGSNLLGIKKKAIDMEVVVPNTGYKIL